MVSCLVKPFSFRTFNKIRNNKISHAIQVRWLSISCQVEKLTGRGLIRVSGSDSTSFLQGIVTNDIKHLETTHKSLYTLFLNTKGRVLYDSIIYRSKEENTFFVECDREALKDLEKHIKMYKLRKKVTVDSVDDEFKLWTLFYPELAEIPGNNVVNVKQEIVVPCSLPNYENKRGDTGLSDIIVSEQSLVYVDPRLPSLGIRVIAPDSENVLDCLRASGVDVKTSALTYRMFRYRLGVAEGISELPVGKCFPLEVNGDYLHGVSFHKGCYIGQELTARTHHTGVVRKRLMPLLLHSETSLTEYPVDTPIEKCTEEKKPAIGKLRGVEKNCALGLMRITEALESGKFRIGQVKGETFRPPWWPQELPKERVDSGSGKRG